MVDYRKWDAIVADLEDDQDDETVEPKVMVLDNNEGEKVRIGPTGYKIEKQNTNMPFQSNNKTNYDKFDDMSKDSENGGEGDKYLWRQDRNEVVILIELDSEKDIKGKNIEVVIIDKLLKINFILKDCRTCIFDKIFNFAVELDEKENIDFEIVSRKLLNEIKRFIKINLKKKCIIPGATFWWNKCFIDEPTLDVTQFKGRTSSSSSSNEMNEIWKEAHRQFKQNIQNMSSPIEMDELNDNNESPSIK